MQVTKELRRELKKGKGRAGALKRSCGQKVLDEDMQELSLYKDDGTVQVHRWINDVQWNAFRGIAKKCAETVNWGKKICQLGRKILAGRCCDEIPHLFLCLSAVLPFLCFPCRHVVLLERRFTLDTFPFAQPLPCGNVH